MVNEVGKVSCEWARQGVISQTTKPVASTHDCYKQPWHTCFSWMAETHELRLMKMRILRLIKGVFFLKILAALRSSHTHDMP